MKGTIVLESMILTEQSVAYAKDNTVVDRKTCDYLFLFTQPPSPERRPDLELIVVNGTIESLVMGVRIPHPESYRNEAYIPGEGGFEIFVPCKKQKNAVVIPTKRLYDERGILNPFREFRRPVAVSYVSMKQDNYKDGSYTRTFIVGCIPIRGVDFLRAGLYGKDVTRQVLNTQQVSGLPLSCQPFGNLPQAF